MSDAIITGASTGIGRATARAFLERGYRVHNLSRRPCDLTEVKDGGVNNLATDLADEQSIAATLHTLAPMVEGASQVALVHNACQMRKDSAESCDSDDLRAVLQTNVVAANSINQRLLPLMPAGSSVVYVGSTLSEKAVAGAFSYVLSKHAVVGMMRATCQDLMGRGIHTACVCPGFTDTEMLRAHLNHDQAALDSVAGGNSFRRLIDPAEIASLILWAHDNPVINGAVLHAHLGQRES